MARRFGNLIWLCWILSLLLPLIQAQSSDDDSGGGGGGGGFGGGGFGRGRGRGGRRFGNGSGGRFRNVSYLLRSLREDGFVYLIGGRSIISEVV